MPTESYFHLHKLLGIKLLGRQIFSARQKAAQKADGNASSLHIAIS